MTLSISVIIPVYNAERFVGEAVASALALPAVGEVILVEDASPDGALAVCEALEKAHDRVRLLRHPDGGNHGAGASRNLGIEAARRPLIAFLDADDYYLPDRFDRALEILEADPSIDGVYDAVGTVCETEEAAAWWRENRKEMALTTVSEAVAPEDLFEALFANRYGMIHTDGIVVRREAFDRAGGFPVQLRMSQDICMWWKLALVSRLAGGVLDRAVAIRRVHGENRIIRSGGRRGYYEYLARRELLRWLPPEHRTAARVERIRTSMVNTWRTLVGPQYPAWQRRVRYWGFLAGVAAQDPSSLGDGYFRHCMKEALGLLALRKALRGQR